MDYEKVMENITVLTHSSIKIEGECIVYIDPYEIQEELHDADIILVTHEHYDHFSAEDMKKVMKEDTVILSTPSVIESAKELQPEDDKRIAVKPNQNYTCQNILIETTVAYNQNKPFHPKEKEWVGYLLTMEHTRIYIAGDTDAVEELKMIHCDVALVPVGGTYTMNAKEAAELVNVIKPQLAIPTHYGSVVGTREDALRFQQFVHPEIQVKICF